jgi:uncharacterized membrane protein
VVKLWGKAKGVFFIILGVVFIFVVGGLFDEVIRATLWAILDAILRIFTGG